MNGRELKCPRLNKDNGRPYTDCSNKSVYRCVPVVEDNKQSQAIANLWDGICFNHYLDYWDTSLGLVAGVKMIEIEE